MTANRIVLDIAADRVEGVRRFYAELFDLKTVMDRVIVFRGNGTCSGERCQRRWVGHARFLCSELTGTLTACPVDAAKKIIFAG